MEEKDIKLALEGLKTDLEAKSKTAADAVKAELAAQIEKVQAAQEKIKGLPEGFDAEKVMKDLAATIDGFDKFQAKFNDLKPTAKILSLKDAIGEAMGKVDEKSIDGLIRNQGASLSVPLGLVDLSMDWKEAEFEEKMQRKTDMVLSNTLTGTTVLSYNQRQAIIPAQKINLRDIVPTVQSPTGQYVTYSENTGGTNNIGTQTEGSAKGNNTYALTATTLTNPYIAGYSRFSKQLLKFLPFMQGTLSRMLMRDYFKKENAAGLTVLATGTGPTTMGSSPDDVKQLIALIGGFLATDYNASFIIVNPATLTRIITSTYTSGYYPGAGTVSFNGNQISIFGVPVIPASWATANKAFLVDADYLERVEVEGLNLAFSYEDSDNFTKNLITARIECQTAFNLMVTQSVCYADLGAS